MTAIELRGVELVEADPCEPLVVSDFGRVEWLEPVAVNVVGSIDNQQVLLCPQLIVQA